ncbi:PREDICTED: olfactory receptor-like protein OLF3 [Myotis brandtii]|uniref:olfactory receptor-like protein OLF3 n=1 Tax=Myotis brandtii TaxID=109478 RepID=UPI000703C6C4|nr:PREDICTED: olfactory receptor-like protein OLF3 [Myotis brandtii]
MGTENQTWVREFILLGLSSDWDTQVSLFVLFSITYMVTVLGNFLIVLLIRLDSQLHTPMYFFLTNLSLVDVSYATTIVPQLLVHFLAEHKVIPLVSCAAQLFFSLGLGGIEFVLLAVMAYDRYVAVCDPLSSIVLLMSPFCLVLLSYVKIISTILKIRSTEGRKKAFHTCASHLTVVILCYGMAIFIYIQPSSGPSGLQEKLISLFYAILTPMLNPMIYSLRNKEVKGAWQKLLGQLNGLTSKLGT